MSRLRPIERMQVHKLCDVAGRVFIDRSAFVVWLRDEFPAARVPFVHMWSYDDLIAAVMRLGTQANLRKARTMLVALAKARARRSKFRLVRI